MKLIAPSGTTLFIGSYLETDHPSFLGTSLGSSTVALTSTGSQNGRLLYHPWGSVAQHRFQNTQTARLY